MMSNNACKHKYFMNNDKIFVGVILRAKSPNTNKMLSLIRTKHVESVNCVNLSSSIYIYIYLNCFVFINKIYRSLILKQIIFLFTIMLFVLLYLYV